LIPSRDGINGSTAMILPAQRGGSNDPAAAQRDELARA